jgi:hypothetical protein
VEEEEKPGEEASDLEEEKSKNWADQVEEEEKPRDGADQVEEEEKSSDIEEEEKPIPKEVEDWRPRAREVIEELRHRLAHEATGPPPVCRVRALCANEGRAWPRLAETPAADSETEFSFQPGTIMTIHRLSEASVGWMYGTLDGKKGIVFASDVEIMD